MEVPVNYLAILLSGVVAMALGFLWYGPYLFGKMWMKLKGLSTNKKDIAKAMKDMPKLYAVTFVACLLTAYVLNHVMAFSMTYFDGAYSMLSTGFMSAFWMWLGFVMPTQLGATIFGTTHRNWKVLAIDTSYQLVALSAMGVVLAVV